ncbi:ABC transporter ATP-binding protein [Lacisediminimonas sp.]|uniref:ABC transporter ATP-binding protein n=1 Tax=Lacisediminimonas sp. TaxID=3060582 RepID=UPI0027228099|nr:ABC transporter ATP-binding protein [Lacisediminimonas sp.]MDO8301012.1 ABC transporter ATP-binding protein [Lacisediminimonas sp.]
MSMLTITGVRTAYDRIDVLHGISLTVEEGTITCILGSNGSGKSTLIRSILNLTPPNQGEILFEGKSLRGVPTHQVIGRGIACIPEGRKIFPKMTVDENLRVGAYQETSGAEIARRAEEVYALFPRLKERTAQLAGTMSGGEQAMVSIGRGLMAKPRLLIIDEPSLGLSPLYVKENFRIISEINKLGITVLLVEQNVRQTLAIAHYGYVLSQGHLVAQGSAQELAQNEEVRAAYFG